MVVRGSVSAIVAGTLLAGFVAMRPALGQDSGRVTVDVERCIELGSDAERRECFAAEVDAVLEAQGATEANDRSGAAEDVEADRAADTGDETASERTRRARGQADERAADAARKSEAAEDEYFGTITELRERAPNRYAIALDNGQIWEQVTGKRYPLRPGLEVRIYPSRWGESYRLSGEGTGGYIQVRRVQ